MQEYGLAEPELIDMEIALRINLYRAVDATLLDIEKVPERTELVPNNFRSSSAESIRRLFKTEKSHLPRYGTSLGYTL